MKEALSAFAVEVLLPRVLQAAADRRRSSSSSSSRAGCLPESLLAVMKEETATQEALGAPLEGPNEPSWVRMQRACKEQQEGLAALQSWLAAHPTPQTHNKNAAAAQASLGPHSSPLSLVGALQPRQQQQHAAADVAADTAAAAAAADQTHKGSPSLQLLDALASLVRFADEHKLLLPVFRDPRAAAAAAAAAARAAGPTVLSLLKALPSAQPAQPFVKAFARYATPHLFRDYRGFRV